MAPQEERLFPKLKRPLQRITSSPLSDQIGDARNATHKESVGGPVRDGTPPINIPSARRSAFNEPVFLPDDASLVEEPITDETAGDRPIRARGSTISFHPYVTSDIGHRQPLRRVESADVTPSVRDCSSSSSEPGQDIYLRSRIGGTQSQSKEEHTVAGGGLLERQAQRPGPRSNEDRTILQSPSESGFLSDSAEPDRLVSLTSDTTAPSLDEARTPLETVNEYFTSSVPASHVDYFTPQDSSAGSWPNRASSQRARRAERPPVSLRKSSRRSSTRSTASSASPASAFLAQWDRSHSTDNTPAPQEPDAEGMEIGDHSQYIIGKEVGHGGFSVVKEVHTFENNTKVIRAVKIVRKNIAGKSESENDRMQADFEQEVDIWRYLKHPYILPLLAVYDTPFATFCITQLVTGGRLFELIKANRRRARMNTASLMSSELDNKSTASDKATPSSGLSPHLAKRYIYQLASALRYLHEDLHVVHRDVKLENCLLDMSDPEAATHGGRVLLCDFGLANWTSNEANSAPAPLNADGAGVGSPGSTGITGSLHYAAPEMLDAPDQVFPPAVDIWAFGVVAFALLTGELPFAHSFEPKVVEAIAKADYNLDHVRNCPAAQQEAEEVMELITSCLELDSDLRWKIADVLDCKWLQGCKELYEEVDCVWT